jgi:hypothetical protein
VKTLDHAETPANHGASENFTGDYTSEAIARRHEVAALIRSMRALAAKS